LHLPGCRSRSHVRHDPPNAWFRCGTPGWHWMPATLCHLLEGSDRL